MAKAKQSTTIPITPAIAMSMVYKFPFLIPGEAKVLDVCAGDGILINAVHSEQPDPLEIDFFEKDAANSEYLQNKPAVNLVGEDFLKCEEYKEDYDLVIGNIPADKEVTYLQKMFECLKPGGSLIALVCGKWETGKTEKDIRCIQWLEKLGAKLHELQDAEKPEGYNARIIEFQKPVAKEFVQTWLSMEKYDAEDLKEFEEILKTKEKVAMEELQYLQHTLADMSEKDHADPDIEQFNGLITRQNNYLKHIHEAQERIRLGTYGICRVTGKLIDKARLRAVPHATLSVEAKTNAQFQLLKDQPADTTVGEDPPAINFLRDYKNYVFFDAGPNGTTGQNQIHIYLATKTTPKDPMQLGEPVYIVYYDNKDSTSLNKGIEQAKQWVEKQKKCRICGCTDNNCPQCIKQLGHPCYWVQDDLCSACENVVKKEPAATEPVVEPVPSEYKGKFFHEIYSLMDGVDLFMKIERLNGKLTIAITPDKLGTVKPVRVSGTPDEIHEGFINAVTAPVNEARELIIELNQYRQSLEEAKKQKIKELDDQAGKDKKSAAPKAKAPHAKNKNTVPKKATKKAAVKKAEGPKKPALPSMYPDLQ